jgi:hypothetical protein
MDYDNYIELYEAVYFFGRINGFVDSGPSNLKQLKSSGLNQSVYNAMIRILVANGLLEQDGNDFVLTRKNEEQHRHILDNIIGKGQKEHYAQMFDNATGDSSFFFDTLSELEYDIYSRYNFQVTSKIGKEAAKHINVAHRKVLELGGNSGGFGTALLAGKQDCSYTIVDTKIPCLVGNELKKETGADIEFTEGDIFELALPDESYNDVILMNLLHDFDDLKCLEILRRYTKYCDHHTKFLIIEDILTSAFEPKDALMHGLRLAVSCKGGKQRTIGEFTGLFSTINYKLEKTITLDSIHTMLILGHCDT